MRKMKRESKQNGNGSGSMVHQNVDFQIFIWLYNIIVFQLLTMDKFGSH